LVNGWVMPASSFNLTQFNPNAPDLDLIIQPPLELDNPVG